MKLKHRKGSTLALTLIIFAVLMIFASFILNFMVTENKQAIYYQNKTQAYYIARSGAEIVEAALEKQLLSYGSNISEHKKFIDNYNITELKPNGQVIPLSIPGIKEVTVSNEIINGKRVIAITSSAEYRGVEQSVKKILYSNIATKTIEGFSQNDGALFVYLEDDPVEYIESNDKKDRNVPKEYVSKVDEKDKDTYKEHPFPNIVDWNVKNAYDNEGYIYTESLPNFDERLGNGTLQLIYNKITGGKYKLSDGNTTLIIDGDLLIDGDVEFSGDVNILINGKLEIADKTTIKGDKYTKTDKNGKTYDAYRLNIYIYNNLNSDVSFMNYDYNVSENSNNFSIVGNLYVNSGNINLGLSKNGYIDGHIIYNGTGNVNIKTNSNSYSQERIITGSVYSPFGIIQLGINSNQIASKIGGQFIGKTIKVFPSNNQQGEKFYQGSSGEGRINRPIPIDITEGIDFDNVKYESFYIR